MRREDKVTIQIVGPFRLLGRDGTVLTPRGRKACALLALLALAPTNQRSRKWLQDKLWSDRADGQGSESLRQTLSEIRRALGPDRDCLVADRFMVGLDRNSVDVETIPEPGTDASGPSSDRMLLEGLEVVRDPEFENWLRDQRLRFEPDTEAPPPRANAEARLPQPPARDLQLVLKEAYKPSPQDSALARSLTDIIAKTIAEIGTVDVLDARGQALVPGTVNGSSATVLVVQADVAQDASGTNWRILLSEAGSNRIVWTTAARQPGTTTLFDDPGVLGQLNQVAYSAIGGFKSAFLANGQKVVATLLCQQGIDHLFRLGRDNFAMADKLFLRAFELEPRGIFLAWRAYLRTFMLMERQYICRQTLIDEALDFMYRALEKEPLNSYVASFSAHVHAIMRRSYVASYELAQRAIQLNRANPLAWACLGFAECYLGKTKAGYERTMMAREIAGGTPFRYHIDGLSCVAGSMAGDIDQAIWCGEASHALSPRFAPPLRYLSALYLSRGQHEQSAEAVQKLQAIEPDFSYEMLSERAYPAAGLQRAKLLDAIPARQI